MTSRLTSDLTPDRPAASPSPSPDDKAQAQAGTPQADAPHVPSPPTSPWWTAPGGKAVDIPAFGRSLLEKLLALLAPVPQPVPLRIRVRARR